MTPDQLKASLTELGFKFGPGNLTGVNWYAWRELPEGAALQCVNNEKPPSLIIEPWALTGQHEHVYSANINISGAYKIGDLQVWVRHSAYSLALDDVLPLLDRVQALLINCWNAGAVPRVPMEHLAGVPHLTWEELRERIKAP